MARSLRALVRNLVSAALATLASHEAWAGDPMLTAGFAPQTVQQDDLTGAVNVLTGALTLSFPIACSILSANKAIVVPLRIDVRHGHARVLPAQEIAVKVRMLPDGNLVIE